ncbi:uncharacterized protein V2V93DRAFT_367378 [Kockiozyma suomiensis]|uniref:uncharacterized protein n=1 Tax=Kockiozyma suomiensis TaxID=1337062 RepID=UPI0033430633
MVSRRERAEQQSCLTVETRNLLLLSLFRINSGSLSYKSSYFCFVSASLDTYSSKVTMHNSPTTTETSEPGGATAPSKQLSIRSPANDEVNDTVALVSAAYLHRRGLANIYIFSHPYFFASLIPLFAFVFGRYSIIHDTGNVIMLTAGFAMAVMSLFARVTDPLQDMAKNIAKGEFLTLSDVSRVAVFGKEIVGVISLKYVNMTDYNLAVESSGSGKILEGPAGLKAEPDTESPSPSERSTRSSAKPKKEFHHGIITSWTVVRRYRHVGLGSDLLAQVLQIAAQDKIESVLIQCLSLEKEAAKSLKANGFHLVSSTKLPGGLGRLRVSTDTYSIDVKEGVKLLLEKSA